MAIETKQEVVGDKAHVHGHKDRSETDEQTDHESVAHVHDHSMPTGR